MAARGHHEIFYAHADHLMATGQPAVWGWNALTTKIIGAKTGKFGEQDKVSTVSMATVPNKIFVGDQPSVGTNIYKSGCCV